MKILAIVWYKRYCRWLLKEYVIKRRDILKKLEDGNSGPYAMFLRSWDKKTEWKPIPFPSSIFLPREQNQNMKSLAMLWYMKYCRRLQRRTDRTRHKDRRTHRAVLTWSFLIHEEELDHMTYLRSLKIGKEGDMYVSLPFSICSLLFSSSACYGQVPGHTWCHSGAARTEISDHSGPRGSGYLQTVEHIGGRMPCLMIV